MRAEEKSQIEILRVFCITAMMWVHISPGLSSPSIVSTGDYRLVGLVLGDTLGRISVSLLSFISGYLLWKTAITQPFATLARRRFLSVLLPMLVWSAIFIILAEGKQRLTGQPSHTLSGLDPTLSSFLDGWTGIAGPTANLSLFFLRDLFVASLILRLAAPLIRRLPLTSTLVVTLMTLMSWTAPVIFRPSILQFLIFGAVAARLGLTIATLSRPRLALPLGYGLSLIGFASFIILPEQTAHIAQATGMMRRLGISILALALSRSFLRLTPALWLIRLGRHSYLAYLIHVPLVGVFWAIWTRLVGAPADASYLIFYLSAPPLVFFLARQFARLIDRWPATAQILLRGKVHRHPRSAPVRLPSGGGGAI